MKKAILLVSILLIASTLTAQEAKQTFTRKVVIEQFTGSTCGWCPRGANYIEEAIGTSTNVVWVKYHAGFQPDFLTNDIANEMTVFFGGSTYAPALMVDRTHLDASKPGPVTGISSPSQIRSLIADAKQVPTACKVYTPEVSFDPATRQLTVTASGRFGDDSYDQDTRVIVFIVEDNVIGYQSDYVEGSHDEYAHMGTVREAITDMWGDVLDVDAANNRTFSHTYTTTLSEDYNYANCKIAVIVHHRPGTDINNSPVLNAAESDYLTNYLGIGEVAEGCSLRLFPNPASQQVYVELDDAADLSTTTLTLYDAMGRIVLRQPAASTRTSLNVSALPAGLYLLRVSTPAGTATRQLMVQ